MEFNDSDDSDNEYTDYTKLVNQQGGLDTSLFLQFAKVASVAVPGGPAAIGALQKAYKFKRMWNSTVGKMSDLEGIIYNTMQPNGLYSRVLITSKLTTIDGVPSHVYNTGMFFNCMESMISLVADWNTHNNALKASNNWEEIKELIGEFEKAPTGAVNPKEMEHIQKEVEAAESDEATLVNLVTKYENCAILRDIQLNACQHILSRKPCAEHGDHILQGKSISEVLINQIRSQDILKARYVSGDVVDYKSYANDRVIDDFKKGIASTDNNEYICYQVGILFAQKSNALSNRKLYTQFIRPRMVELGNKIRQVAKDLKKGKKTKVKLSKLGRLSKGVFGFGSKMRSKAGRFTNSMNDMVPRKMKGAMSKAYLAKKLKTFMARFDSLETRWNFVIGCLHLEVTYDMWEDRVRNDSRSDYGKWLDYSNEIVIRLHKCMTDPNSSFEKAVSRSKREGLGCVLLSEVKKHLKALNYSKGFEDILVGHMTNLTSVDGALIAKGTEEGSTHFDIRKLTAPEEEDLVEDLDTKKSSASSDQSTPSASSDQNVPSASSDQNAPSAPSDPSGQSGQSGQSAPNAPRGQSDPSGQSGQSGESGQSGQSKPSGQSTPNDDSSSPGGPGAGASSHKSAAAKTGGSHTNPTLVSTDLDQINSSIDSSETSKTSLNSYESDETDITNTSVITSTAQNSEESGIYNTYLFTDN